ncbi:MAG: pilus assembly protein PilM [Candidatus Muiribacteriota bacterium]
MKIFESKNKNIILDIGTRNSKALILEKVNGNTFQINHAMEEANYNFNFLPLQESKINDEENILEVLRLVYSRLKSMEKNVFVTIPDHVVIIRLINVKKSEVDSNINPKEAFKKAVLKKLKPTLPISIDRWFFDMQEVEDNNKEKIFLIEAILRNNLFEIEKQIRKLGLNPVGVDINSFNVVNLFSDYMDQEENKDKNISIVCFNNKSTTITVFRNGKLRTAQTRLIGSNDFAKKLSEAEEISHKEAEKILYNETLFLPEIAEEQDSIKNFKIIKPVFSELIMSLFNVYEYYTENFKESEIHKVIITGGFSNIKNIKHQLRARLNIDVVKGTELINCVDSSGNEVPENQLALFLPALGSAIR